jgi:glycosyltransferase involved in cell wall biosynthesis
MKVRACIIIGDSFTFPEGDAATNRVHTYAKGFVENGLAVHIVCFRSDYLSVHEGETEGIKFYNPFRQSERNPWFIVRRLNNIRKYLNTLVLFRRIRKEQRVENVIAYTIRKNTQLFAFLLARLSGASLILERSEHPFKAYKNQVTEKISGTIRVKFEIWFSDYIFCISDYLMEFYKGKGAEVDKLFKVPSTVDVSRFNQGVIRVLPDRYICYSGSLTRMKDGVDILISAFAMIVNEFPDIMLVLVGKADTAEDETYFRNLADELGITGKVLFTGKLPRNDIPPYICNAEALVLARPNSIVADAGFPSKVSEYLSTGRPVVVTKVGEIPSYLTDMQSAFLAEPGDAEAFAGKLREVLSDNSRAEEVGIKGQEIAYSVFDYKLQATRIMKFLEQER